MKKWEGSIGCAGRTHCVSCLTDEPWRETLRRAGFKMPIPCAFGVTKLTASTVQRDALIALATTSAQLQAIAKGDLRKCSPCGQKSYDDHETNSGNQDDYQAEGAERG